MKSFLQTLERDSGRGSLSEKVTGDKVKVKEKINTLRTHSTLIYSQVSDVVFVSFNNYSITH